MPSQKSRMVAAIRLPDDVERAFEAQFDFDQGPDDPAPATAFLQRAKGAKYIILAPGIPLTEDMVGSLRPELQAVGTFSVGTDHVDARAMAKHGLPLFNTPDVLTDATADLAMLLILGATRRAREGQDLIRSGNWTGWRPNQLLGTQITGKTLGVLGMGRIGRAVATRAHAFGMKIAYHNRRPASSQLGLGEVFVPQRERLAAQSDVLLVAAPAIPELRGVIDHAFLQRMKPGAVLVNISRGDLIVDDALIAALSSGHLSAAGLDVFNNEPKVDPRYSSLENVFALPHLGSATIETRHAMGLKLLDQFVTFDSGQSIRT